MPFRLNPMGIGQFWRVDLNWDGLHPQDAWVLTAPRPPILSPPGTAAKLEGRGKLSEKIPQGGSPPFGMETP